MSSRTSDKNEYVGDLRLKHPRHKSTYRESLSSKIIEMYEDGWVTSEISAILGIQVGHVSDVLRVYVVHQL